MFFLYQCVLTEAVKLWIILPPCFLPDTGEWSDAVSKPSNGSNHSSIGLCFVGSGAQTFACEKRLSNMHSLAMTDALSKHPLLHLQHLRKAVDKQVNYSHSTVNCHQAFSIWSNCLPLKQKTASRLPTVSCFSDRFPNINPISTSPSEPRPTS